MATKLSRRDIAILRACNQYPIRGWFYRYHRLEIGGSIDGLVNGGLLRRDWDYSLSYAFVLTDAGRAALDAAEGRL